MKHMIWIWILSALAAPAFAQAEDWDALRTEAQGLRARAKEIRTVSKQKLEVDNQACWEKFLVSDCQADAKKAQRQSEREAQKIDLEALAIERRVAAHDREVRQAEKAEKEKEKQAKAAERAEQFRLEDEKRQRKLEQVVAEEEKLKRKREKMTTREADLQRQLRELGR